MTEQKVVASADQASATSSELKKIPISWIRENPVALRSVNRQSEDYTGLVDSIKKVGVLSPILVREIKDPETGQTLYGLIDGLHRFSASQDAGLSEIPAQVRTMADAAVLEAQIIANVHKVETRPVEYSKQLMRILAQNPTLTISELATKLAKSPSWLDDRLGLNKLPENIGTLVDEEKIVLSNAYALAKLSALNPEEAANYVDRAMTMTPQEFVPIVTGRIKELKDAKRQGKDATPAEFVPHPVLRKISELKDEMANPTIARSLCKTDVEASAFTDGIKWALQMDGPTIQARKDKEAARVQMAEDAKKKRLEDKERKDAEKAAAEAAKIKLPN